jgi:nicotinate phosphoribosyltransferase
VQPAFQDAELAYLRPCASSRATSSTSSASSGSTRSTSASPLPSGEIEVRIQGPWLHTILFEIPVLAIINEVYFRNTQKKPDISEGRRRLETKIGQLQDEGLGDLKIADYGTRRRFSKAWHEEVLRTLVTRLGRPSPRGSCQFAGTSNVLYAMKLGLTPLGTMAHEYLQACQALGPRLRDSQVFGFESGRANTAATWASRCRTCTA